ncbi:hypothetical protein BS78_02G012700 [Paspalum vaginatum]|nr:hypothetical protein BS78_02G012700 [Paspalum vaginatum]
MRLPETRGAAAWIEAATDSGVAPRVPTWTQRRSASCAERAAWMRCRSASAGKQSSGRSVHRPRQRRESALARPAAAAEEDEDQNVVVERADTVLLRRCRVGGMALALGGNLAGAELHGWGKCRREPQPQTAMVLLLSAFSAYFKCLNLTENGMLLNKKI